MQIIAKCPTGSPPGRRGVSRPCRERRRKGLRGPFTGQVAAFLVLEAGGRSILLGPRERKEARHDGRASRRVVATMNGVMACIGRVRWSPFFSDYEDTITHRAPEYPDMSLS
jgi:hypothetical protein